MFGRSTPYPGRRQPMSIAGRSSQTIHWSIRPVLLCMFVFVLLGGILLPSGVAADSGESRVSKELQRQADEQPDKNLRVIVTRLAKSRAGDLQVGKLGGIKLRNLPHDAFVAEVPGRALRALGGGQGVKFVELDAPMVHTGTVDPSKLGPLFTGAVNASALWQTGTPLTGAGVGVAVIDTGINDNRSDWKDTSGASRIVAQTRFSVKALGNSDGHGHGTHVAGIIAGNSWFHWDSARKGKYIGVAPRARLINVKASDETGMSYVSDVVSAIDWVINNRQVHNIRVINLSMVSSVAESYKVSTLSAAVERAWFNGILVVVAAGNAGPDTMGYPPANDPFVVTVGAADTMGTLTRDDDGMAPWSSYGITQDGFAKPEVVAPGRMIAAPLAGDRVTLAQQLPDRIVDGDYIRLSGTSMSAPVVAGVAALAFQAHPEWTNDQVKWLLMNTATKLGAGMLPGQGAGEVDAAAVARYAGTPLVANQGIPISEQLVGPSGATVYEPAASWSTSTWSTSTWSTASWSTSTWSTSTWSTSTWSTTANWAGIDIE